MEAGAGTGAVPVRSWWATPTIAAWWQRGTACYPGGSVSSNQVTLPAESL